MACMVCSMITMVMPSPRCRRITASMLFHFLRGQGPPASRRAAAARLAGERAGELHQAQLLGGEAGGRPVRVGRKADRASASAASARPPPRCGARHRRRPRRCRARVMRGNGRTIWKVRPTAKPADCVRLLADASSRRRAGPCPRRACRKPLSRLNSVVLPAPFGPMMPSSAPRPTVEADPCTALSPPKRLRECRDLGAAAVPVAGGDAGRIARCSACAQRAPRRRRPPGRRAAGAPRKRSRTRQ